MIAIKILLIEPFFAGSHKQWALDFQQHSKHEVNLLTLPGNFWKWRMHGGAVTLASQFISKKLSPDLIIVSDMLDLCVFQSLTKTYTANTPFAIYFHENQLNYPWSPTDGDVSDKRDNHYAFINYTSALAADKVFFNSEYHRNAFLEELPKFLKGFPDNKNIETVEIIKNKSSVLPLGVDLQRFD